MCWSLQIMSGLSFLNSSFSLNLKSRFRDIRTTRQCARYKRHDVLAAQFPDSERVPNGDRGSQADDAELQRELRAKVKELFGGSENVSILVTGDRAEFNVRQAPSGEDLNGYKAALATIASIAVISIIAGILFTYMYATGAVHGSPQPKRRYEMPQFSSTSYVDPYELLESERN